MEILNVCCEFVLGVGTEVDSGESKTLLYSCIQLLLNLLFSMI